jgi:hypothetical protein
MRTVVFFDGQNLYHNVRDAWSPKPHVPGSVYGYPSYDVEKLASALVQRVPGRTLVGIRFYTGVPSPHRGPDEAFWHGFWGNKLRHLKARGVYVYRGRVNPGGQEKGVDVSLAIDLVRMTYERLYDAAIIVSQDWDFGPAVKLAKEVAKADRRSLYFESAFPVGGSATYGRGVPGTFWVPITKELYDTCIDPTDYRVTPR